MSARLGAHSPTTILPVPCYDARSSPEDRQEARTEGLRPTALMGCRPLSLPLSVTDSVRGMADRDRLQHLCLFVSLPVCLRDRVYLQCCVYPQVYNRALSRSIGVDTHTSKGATKRGSVGQHSGLDRWSRQVSHEALWRGLTADNPWLRDKHTALATPHMLGLRFSGEGGNTECQVVAQPLTGHQTSELALLTHRQAPPCDARV